MTRTTCDRDIDPSLLYEPLEPPIVLADVLRLGEGTGAALAMNVVEAAVHVLTEVATFAEAGVSGAD